MARYARRRVAVGLFFIGACASSLAGAGSFSTPAQAGRPAPEATARMATHGRIAARLDAKRLAPVQAGEVRLNYRFLRPSSSFSYRLERKNGSGWLKLRVVKLEGRFKGAHTATVARLFGKRAVRPGVYRLRLDADRSHVAVWFGVFAAEPLSGVSSVSGGGRLTCARLAGGGVDCWGFNRDGELGNGSNAYSPTPVAVSGITTALSVDSGYRHACALLQDGTITCWGYNQVGALGNGTTDNSSTPIAVSGIAGAIAQGTGAGHSCALGPERTLSCWGDNETGELGNGTVSSSKPFGATIPVQVSGIAGVAGVNGGLLHTCALISGGTVDCWGYNRDGQVGNGSKESARPYAVTTPQQVSGITDAVAVSSGAFHTCALLAGGSISCWGYNLAGELGNGTLSGTLAPVPVVGITDAVAVSSGAFHTCALIAGGRVECWGEDEYGQLGDGKMKNSPRPVRVPGLTNVVSISAGYFQTCAVLATSEVKCWGRNDYGQLGSGTLGPVDPLPITVVLPAKT
jgi:alpha-tubulin suppressor-like RCC1 family protein